MKALKGIAFVMREPRARIGCNESALLFSIALTLLLVPATANAQNQSATTNPAWLELYHRLKEECVQWGFHGAIGGCLLEKDKEYGKELDQAYRKALTLAGTTSRGPKKLAQISGEHLQAI